MASRLKNPFVLLITTRLPVIYVLKAHQANPHTHAEKLIIPLDIETGYMMKSFLLIETWCIVRLASRRVENHNPLSSAGSLFICFYMTPYLLIIRIENDFCAPVFRPSFHR